MLVEESLPSWLLNFKALGMYGLLKRSGDPLGKNVFLCSDEDWQISEFCSRQHVGVIW